MYSFDEEKLNTHMLFKPVSVKYSLTIWFQAKIPTNGLVREYI